MYAPSTNGDVVMELNEHCTDFSCTLDCNPMAVVIGHLHEMHALEASLRENEVFRSLTQPDTADA